MGYLPNLRTCLFLALCRQYTSEHVVITLLGCYVALICCQVYVSGQTIGPFSRVNRPQLEITYSRHAHICDGNDTYNQQNHKLYIFELYPACEFNSFLLPSDAHLSVAVYAFGQPIRLHAVICNGEVAAIARGTCVVFGRLKNKLPL